jgi:hypothetical protein
LIVATLFDNAIISTLATKGVAMHSLKFGVVATTLLAAFVFAFALDLIKVPTFRRFHIT